MQLAAVADVHSPRYFAAFQKSMSDCHIPDLLLLAGDMVDPGKAYEYTRIVDVIESRLGHEIPIVACFGNDEDRAMREEIVDLLGYRVHFLDEATFRIDVGTVRLGIVGASTGAGTADSSEDAGIYAVRKAFERRADHLSRLLAELADVSTHTILLEHYSPFSETASRGNFNTFSWWASKIVESARPNVIVHGHIHNSLHIEAEISGTLVLNVALPLVNKVTTFRL